MTATDRPVRADVEPVRADVDSPSSVRQPLAGARGVGIGLALLLVATEVVAGWRAFGPAWQGSDLLYHSALANAILRGELPPGGPYAGLPAYYPPGFHLLAAGVMTVLGLDFTQANRLLTLAWLPVLPLGTFLLMRWLTGRPWVALVAATLTVFAGGYDISAGRLWVNSLFMVGQEAYPLYPRDLVFGMLPFAVLAFLRALAGPGPRRAVPWAVVSGVLFGACALTQVQLLLPLPIALAVGAVLVAATGRGGRRQAIVVLVVTGGVALALFAPWFAGQLEVIRRNGGIALGSSDTLLPARFGPWSYPREFGLLLPLGIIGSGVACLFLRRDRADGPMPAGTGRGPWRPALAQGPAVLAAWFVLAFVLAVLYQPSWPLEDALRPQRLWMLSSQPMTMLAAIGLVALAEDAVGRLRSVPERPLRLVAAAVAGVIVMASAPASLATARLLAGTWTRPTYADLDLQRDHVPAFDRLLPRAGPRAVVLTYEDWSSLVWFETGEQVVAVLPSGFSKLAFDPAIFTARSQDQRRGDVLVAFTGDGAAVAGAARDYGASYLVLARRGGELGLFDTVAAVAAGVPGAVTGAATVQPGNGWDTLALEHGASLDLTLATTGRVDLEIRVAPIDGDMASQLDVVVVGPDGSDRSTTALHVPPGTPGSWQLLLATVATQPGDRLRLRAIGPVAVQSVRGFTGVASVAVGASPIPGWRITKTTDDAVVLEPAG